MAILKEFKQIVQEKTGKNFLMRLNEVINVSRSIKHNHIGATKFFSNNIVEVKFLRRIDQKSGYKKTRRMICTSNFFFAKRFAKHFGQYNMPNHPKHQRKKSYYKKHDIILVWDLLENNFRIVSLDKWKIIDFIPITLNNMNIINAFARSINPRRLTKSMKKSYYNR